MEIKRIRTTLSNGLPLVAIEVPGSRSAVVSFWTKAGTRLNPRGKEGLAHFLEHVLLKKSKKYPSDAKLAEALERVGAWKNAWTGRDYINFLISTPAKSIDTSLYILAESIFRPLIDKEGVDLEREVIRKEQIRKDSLPEELVWDIWLEAFFNDSPLQYSNLGTKTSLYEIAERDLNDFWEKYFKSLDSLLVITGGIDRKEAAGLAEKYFGKEKLKSPFKVPVFKYKEDMRVVFAKKNLSQATLVLSFKTQQRMKELYPLILLRGILFGGWSSRIPQRLRVKEGLIYNWEGDLYRYIDSAAFAIKLSTDKNNFPKMASILCEELRKVRQKGVAEKELKRVKGYLEGTVLRSVETSYDYHNWYAKYEFFWPDEVESVEERINNLRKVKAAEIQGVAEKYITKDNWYLAVVGNIKERDLKIDL